MASHRTLTQDEVFGILVQTRKLTTEQGWTSEEFRRRTGFSRTQSQVKIKRGIAAGEIEHLGFTHIRSQEGRLIQKPIYRFTDKLTNPGGCERKAKKANR